MKNLIKYLPILLIIPIISGCSNQDKSHNLTIYNLNDSHGDLLRDPDSNSYGLDGINYLIKEDKINNPDDETIFISTGDMFQGQYVSNFTRGRAVIDALNYMNLDAFILGNHEFDWSLDEIYKYKDGNKENGELNAPILCANLIEKSTGKAPTWIEPYTVINTPTHKVGVIGLMGENLESSILYDMIKDYEFISPYEITKNCIKELKSMSCDTIIIGTHEYDKNVFRNLINENSEINAIFGGHTHRNELDSYTNKNQKLIYSIQTGANNEGFSKIKLNYDQNNNYLDSEATHIKNKSSGVNVDTSLRDLILDKYQKEFNDSNEILKRNFRSLSRSERGSLVTSLLAKDVNFGVVNKGGIRYDTKYQRSKDLYLKQLFRILPFDNKIYQIQVSKAFFDSYEKNEREYNYIYKNDNGPSNDYYIVNIIDYVYLGKYSNNLRNNSTIIKTLDLNIRDYIVKALKEK